ncbi:MAG: C25 family cysteine peptidase, partial [Thermodesulfobacteriota bacterium]|nr:C25 family cysteine peptidase [Thermodesulfobacteriota bacterium]
MKKAFLFLGLLVALTGIIFIAPAMAATDWATAANWSGTFQAGDYDIIENLDGTQTIQMAGFPSGGAPGNPELPGRVYNIALPPHANFKALQLHITSVDKENLPGTYDIGPAPACAAAIKGRTIVSYGQATSIVNGRNPDVYTVDQLFAEEYLVLLPYSQMRKWAYARIQFSPFQYNPVTGQLVLIKSVSFEIRWPGMAAADVYDKSVGQLRSSLKRFRDQKADRRMMQMLYNPAEAQEMYAQIASGVTESLQSTAPESAPSDSPSAGAATADYVIITTNAIESNLSSLDDFQAHLEDYGYTPLVITEDEYAGLTGQAPDGTAEKIRQWLINNYIDYEIEYVLLIGDPHPTSGDIPMKMCHPYLAGSYDDCPTDYFYADLTGDWDLNGDQVYGTYANDRGAGGVDFAEEVIVGRIPLVDENYATVDSILEKTMNYELATGDQSWRNSILLPMAISNYANEDRDGYSRTDGLDVPEDVIDGYADAYGFFHHVFYEKAGLDPVPDTAAYDNILHTGLGRSAVINEWQNSYGCVFWWGHGSQTGVYQKYWNSDDGDGVPEGGEMSWPAFFTSSDCSSLDNDHPSIVYQSSCTNGYPENANNLGYALLKEGAVATVSASRVSWYMIGSWFHSSNPDNSNIGFVFMENLITNNDPVGAALFNAKNESDLFSNWWGGQSWMNRMDFNLYGAPHVAMTPPPPAETWSNLIEWNGNLVADFEGRGMWYHDGSSWNWMTNQSNVQQMLVWD